jgi:hypothetical protein
MYGGLVVKRILLDIPQGVWYRYCMNKRPRRRTVKLPPAILEAFREFGRQGGKKGGKARMAGLTPRERQELAKKAIAARWARYRKATAQKRKGQG